LRLLFGGAGVYLIGRKLSLESVAQYNVMRRAFGFIWRGLVCLPLAIALLWAFGALHYDFPILHGALVWIFALGSLAALIFVPGFWKKAGALFLAWLLVLSFWLTLRPRDNRSRGNGRAPSAH
jgi:hypothetical protein